MTLFLMFTVVGCTARVQSLTTSTYDVPAPGQVGGGINSPVHAAQVSSPQLPAQLAQGKSLANGRLNKIYSLWIDHAQNLKFATVEQNVLVTQTNSGSEQRLSLPALTAETQIAWAEADHDRYLILWEKDVLTVVELNAQKLTRVTVGNPGTLEVALRAGQPVVLLTEIRGHSTDLNLIELPSLRSIRQQQISADEKLSPRAFFNYSLGPQSFATLYMANGDASVLALYTLDLTTGKILHAREDLAKCGLIEFAKGVSQLNGPSLAASGEAGCLDNAATDHPRTTVVRLNALDFSILGTYDLSSQTRPLSHMFLFDRRGRPYLFAEVSEPGSVIVDVLLGKVVKHLSNNLSDMFQLGANIVMISTRDQKRGPFNEAIDVGTGTRLEFPRYHQVENSKFFQDDEALFIYGEPREMCASCIYGTRVW